VRRIALETLYGHDQDLYEEVKREVEEHQGLLENDEEWVSVEQAHKETGLTTRKISRLAKDGKWRAWKGNSKYPQGMWHVCIPRELRKASTTKRIKSSRLDPYKETKGLFTAVVKRWPICEETAALSLDWYTISGNGKLHANAVYKVIKGEALAQRCDFHPVILGRGDRRCILLLKILSNRLQDAAKKQGKIGVVLSYPNITSRILLAFHSSTQRITEDKLLKVNARDFLLSQSDFEAVQDKSLNFHDCSQTIDIDVAIVRRGNRAYFLATDGSILSGHEVI